MFFQKQQDEIKKLAAIHELLDTVKTVYRDLKRIDKNVSELSSNLVMIGNANLVLRREMNILIRLLHEDGIIDPDRWDKTEAEVGRKLSEFYNKEFKRLKELNEKNKHSSERK